VPHSRAVTLRAFLALCATACVFFALGYFAHRNEWLPSALRDAMRAPTEPARPFGGDAFPLQHPALDAESQAEILALGYAQGTNTATSSSGVTVHDAAHAWAGLNLYTSGHGPEAVLMSMDGKTLHTWRCDLKTAMPGFVRPDHVREAATRSWRRAHVYPNGDLLAIFEGIAIIKLGRDSEVQWVYARGCHHDVAVKADGEILVLTSDPRDGIIDNGIASLDAQGRETSHVSLLDCFRNSQYATLLDWLPKAGDVLHVNTITLLDGAHAAKHEAFRHGNVLISALTLNTVAVVDVEAKTVPWAITGMWRAQHDPSLLANGNMLVFDNRGAVGTSRALEIDPLTQSIEWQHPDAGAGPFYSEWCGAAVRLPNGNTLITETDNGRAFEVTPDHRIVWEFVNPNQFNEAGVRMVAALFEVVRLPVDYAASWLSEP